MNYFDEHQKIGAAPIPLAGQVPRRREGGEAGSFAGQQLPTVAGRSYTAGPRFRRGRRLRHLQIRLRWRQQQV